jgi:cytochrome c
VGLRSTHRVPFLFGTIAVAVAALIAAAGLTATSANALTPRPRSAAVAVAAILTPAPVTFDAGSPADAPAPDQTPPVISFSGTAPGWSNHDETLTVTASDPQVPGQDTSGAPVVETAPSATGPWSPYAAPLPMTEGQTTVWACATDAAGNASDPVSTTVKIDESAPVSSVAGVPAGWARSALITLNADDALSGVGWIDYRAPGMPGWMLYAGPFTPPQGTTVYEYRSTDVVGNTSAPKTFTVSLDSGKPVPLALANASVKRGKAVALRYRVNDVSPTANVTIRISRGAKLVRTRKLKARTTGVGLAWSFTCKLPAGRYTWKVYAVDLAGNAQARPAARTLTVK